MTDTVSERILRGSVWSTQQKEAIRECSKPISVMVPEVGEVTDIGRVINPLLVKNRTGTVIDEQICQNGSYILLPELLKTIMGKRASIIVPRMHHEQIEHLLIIDDVGVKANNILRVIEQYKRGEREASAVRKVVDKYLLAILLKIGTKNGLLAKHILGTRISNSVRAVIIPNAFQEPYSIGVPAPAMQALNIKDGSLVIAGRDPVIWDGSIEVLKARSCSTDCLEIHPILCEQLGADFDGDTMWLFSVPDDAECQREARKRLFSFASQRARFTKNLLLANENPSVDWDNFKDECKKRYRTTGYSVGPEDILEGSDHLKKLETITGKKLAQECLTISRGVSDEALRKYIVDINEQLLVMKTYLGPTGAISSKLKLFAGLDPVLARSANDLSQMMQQALFDSKGLVDTEQGAIDIAELLQIVNKQGEFTTSVTRKVGPFKVSKLLEGYGLPREKIWPIIFHLYAGFFIAFTIKTICSAKPVSTKNAEAAILACKSLYSPSTTEEECKETIIRIADFLSTTPSSFLKQFYGIKITLGSTSSVMTDDIYKAINSTDLPTLIKSVMNVFIRDNSLRYDYDSGGITSIIYHLSMGDDYGETTDANTETG